MSKKFDLMSSVAIVALLASASTAFAQNVHVDGGIIQNAQNKKTVNNTGNIDNQGVLNGIGIQGSVTASGALAGVTATTLNTNAPSITINGDIRQTATNTKQIQNLGSIDTVNIDGDGASLQVSASGATSAAGYTSVNNTNVAPSIRVNRNINQNTQ